MNDRLSADLIDRIRKLREGGFALHTIAAKCRVSKTAVRKHCVDIEVPSLRRGPKQPVHRCGYRIELADEDWWLA